jgi:hypothetical protein
MGSLSHGRALTLAKGKRGPLRGKELVGTNVMA